MFNIKEIFKASVCSFCENIYEYNSIDEEDFIKSLNITKIREYIYKDIEPILDTLLSKQENNQ